MLSEEVHVALAALKAEAAELQHLLTVVRPPYFWSNDLQKALSKYVLSAPAGVDLSKQYLIYVRLTPAGKHQYYT